MRDDIKQIAFDKGKHSRRWDGRGRKTAKRLDLKNLREEDQNSSAKAKMIKGWNHSWPNHNIISKFLISRTGQNWDKVYSEYCEQADPRTDKGRDLRKALLQEVHTNIQVDKGMVTT